MSCTHRCDAHSGFDGVQLHAAHGGLLSRFLSPYTNRREDDFGGTAEKRKKIIREIVSGARQQVGKFPILIKMNCTDYLAGGVDIENFPALAKEVVAAGVDAIELSGGMWECLFRSEEELGFRPVPAPESHTRIGEPERQSYFFPYAEILDLPIPVIREPGLPNRWRAGTGKRMPECVSYNSCIYAMYVHPGRPEPGPATCICKTDKKQHQKAQKWLAVWRENQS